MSRADMSPRAVSLRLRELGDMSDLSPERRLRTKVDMSSSAVSRRLRSVGEALELCRRLAARPAPSRPR